MKRSASADDNSTPYKYQKKLDKAVEEEFVAWKKARGLEKEEWDAERNGPIESRCVEPVYQVLFGNRYERPTNWNDPSKYWMIHQNEEDGNHNTHYVRCDQLNASQFDHLFALKMMNYGEFGMENRICRWFSASSDADNGTEDSDDMEVNGYTGYYSHFAEQNLFSVDKFDEQGVPIVLVKTFNKPFNAHCANNTGFAVGFCASGF